MATEKHSPQTEAEWLALRANDLTSTEISALFGISPYMTEFELWHAKHDKTYAPLTPNERMKWGTRLQDSIAAGVAEEQGWTLTKLDRFMYLRNPSLRIGSSFDFSFSDKDNARGLLEIKNVDGLAFLNGWAEVQGGLEAPPHIELQVQHQMLVSGHKQAYIGALVGGNDLKLIRRVPDQKVHEAILEAAARFWASVEAHKAPAPDFQRDAAFISKLFGFAQPNKVVKAEQRVSDLAVAYKAAGEAEAVAKKEKEAARAEILTLIGDAEKVLGDGFNISASVVAPTRVEAYDRAGFRNFRVTFKKAKS